MSAGLLPPAVAQELAQLRALVRRREDERDAVRVTAAVEVAELRRLVLAQAHALDLAADRIATLELRQQGMAERALELLERIERLEGPCP